jgi:hypothetical protein
MDVDEVLQMLVKNVDPSAPWIAEGLVVDVAVADKDVVVVTGDQTHGAMPHVGTLGTSQRPRGLMRPAKTSRAVGCNLLLVRSGLLNETSQGVIAFLHADATQPILSAKPE